MAWTHLNVKLTVNDTTIERQGGKIVATLTVSGVTDEQDESNSFVATLRDDHIIPDIMWNSGKQAVGPAESVNQRFEVELRCNRRGKVVGPDGSSHEKTARVYAHVVSAEMESQSNDIPVSCV